MVQLSVVIVCCCYSIFQFLIVCCCYWIFGYFLFFVVVIFGAKEGTSCANVKKCNKFSWLAFFILDIFRLVISKSYRSKELLLPHLIAVTNRGG